MKPIQSWSKAFHDVIASVFANMTTNFTPEDMERDLMGDGFYVSKSLSVKIVTAFINNGYILKADEEVPVSYITSPEDEKHGVMFTEAEDEEDTFVWVYFEH